MNNNDVIFKYPVRNRREYNRALVRHGSITLWVDEQAVAAWRNEERLGRRGRPRIYTDTAIECALIVKTVCHLSLRAAQGFLESVVRLMGVKLPVPDYTTVSRRQARLNLVLAQVASRTARHVVIDTTGLKVYGDGERGPLRNGGEIGEKHLPRCLYLAN